ncbi:hypothetical protein GH754_04795 [Salinibacillus xinjiangensis]|uniref:NarG-like domain-containing protein n=1 Tax=Salinibacillus xinjiangensis TaxID=1229268 RepID=A0A6G1X440_9BACI|nr:hypothetical protein [Salinibacillus xinjiangensis]
MSFILYASIPFTRLVHIFSMPFEYLWWSYVVYRKRPTNQDTPKPRNVIK